MSSSSAQSPKRPSAISAREPRPRRGAVAVLDQLAGGARERLDRRPIEAERREPDGLALAHRDAAGDAGEILAEADLEQPALELAEPARPVEPLRPALQLAQRLDVGREPGEAVDRVLLALQERAVDRAVARHQSADRVGGARQQLGRGAERLARSPAAAARPARPARLPGSAIAVRSCVCR